MKMNSWDKNRKELLYKQKLQSVKSTMQKILTSPTGTTLALKKKIPTSKPVNRDTYNLTTFKKDNSNGNLFLNGNSNANVQKIEYTRQENHQKQYGLKRILRDYGLQQYLRKFYELGYDDNNIHKLAMITHKDLDEFLMNIKIFPGHRVKVVSFLENLKRIFNNPNRLVYKDKMKKTSNSLYPAKRFHSVNSNRIAKKNLTDGYMNIKLANKPKSVETMRTNNKIVKSFAKGNGFGFNYYLDYNDETSGASGETFTANGIKNRDIKSADSENKSEMKSFKEEQIENINEEIDKLLNYYMVQLNEKLDDSIDSMEEDDSTLSNLNSIHNILNMNAKNKVENISEIIIKNSETLLSINKSDRGSMKEEINEDLGNNNNNLNMSNGKQRENITISNSNNSNKSNKSNKSNLKQTDEDNIEEEFFNNYDDLNLDVLEESLVIKKSINKDNKEEVNYPINKEKINTPKSEQKIKNPIILTTQEKGQVIHGAENNQNNSLINNSSNQTKTNNNNLNQSEDLLDCRLVRSCEEGYIRQHIDHFDVEYMCRCLGLALMKHIESGQEKQHIMELINLKENFSFFNSLFNVNIEFFNTFFNMENQDKISNLDKLDLNEIETRNKQSAEKEHIVAVVEEEIKSSITKPISFMSHMVKGSPTDTEYNYHKLGSEIDKEVNTINDYFNYSPQVLNSRYKNMNENTKNILCQDLNPINETDSVEYINNNLLFTVDHKKDKGDFIDMLRQSAVDFVGVNNDNEEDNNEEVIEKEEDNNDQEEEKEEEQEQDNNNDQDINNPNLNNPEINNNEQKFNNYNLHDEKEENIDEYYYKETPIHKINEDILEKDDPVFESGMMESNYIIDVTNAEKLKNYLLKTAEIYDDDYDYATFKIPFRRFVHPTDPGQIFEFCANIIIMTKMEKEVIMICMIYVERLIFNTGILMNSRNWKRIIFTALVIASKIWDDDSFENNHFAQVFPHLKIGEINLLERSFLEFINYKVYVKCSEYFKYFFIIKSIALKYNFNGLNLVPISVEKMMQLQESAYQVQRKLKKKYSCNNSAQF